MVRIFCYINGSNEPVSAERYSFLPYFGDNKYSSENINIGSGFMETAELRYLHTLNNIVNDEEKSIVGASIGKLYDKKIEKNQHGRYSDTQYIIDLYAKEELNFTKYLNGLFNAVIYDIRRNKIVIANDRYGFHPLFYYIDDEKCVFASKATSVLKSAMIQPQIDDIAVAELFILKHTLKDKTLFQRINLFKPATTFVYDVNKKTYNSYQYWDFMPKVKTSDMSELFPAFKKLVQKSVEKRVQDKNEIGVLLSGGLDSRLIAGFAARTNVDVITFTFGHKNCRQKIIAKRVAERLGVENIFYEIPSDFISKYAEDIVYNGDGLIRIRDCHFISLLEEVRKKVSTVLMGTFDSMFRGSAWIENVKNREDLINHIIQKTGDLSGYEAVFSTEFIKNTKFKMLQNMKEIVDDIPFGTMSDIERYWSYRYYNRSLFHTFQYINWYLETRHPYLDKELVDYFAYKLPFEFIKYASFYKRALDYCFPHLSDIPYERTMLPPSSHPYIERVGRGILLVNTMMESLLDRLTKNRFSSALSGYRRYDKWLRTGSKEFTLNTLVNSKTIERDLFKIESIRNIVNNHMEHKKNNDQLICDLINLELFNRLFIDLDT